MKKYTIGIPWSGCEYKSDIPVTSEQEAVAIACGIELGGGETKVFMQDSGYLNCLNNNMSLIQPYDFNKITMCVKEVSEPEHHKFSNRLFRWVYEFLYRP